MGWKKSMLTYWVHAKSWLGLHLSKSLSNEDKADPLSNSDQNLWNGRMRVRSNKRRSYYLSLSWSCQTCNHTEIQRSADLRYPEQYAYNRVEQKNTLSYFKKYNTLNIVKCEVNYCKVTNQECPWLQYSIANFQSWHPASSIQYPGYICNPRSSAEICLPRSSGRWYWGVPKTQNQTHKIIDVPIVSHGCRRSQFPCKNWRSDLPVRAWFFSWSVYPDQEIKKNLCALRAFACPVKFRRTAQRI